MLLIDLGNSSFKAQYWQSNSLVSSCCLPVQAGWSARFTDFLMPVNALNCYHASVPGSQVQAEMLSILATKFSVKKIVGLLPQKCCVGIVNAYHQSGRLGVDRWLALLGASTICDADAIIIDAGSAITVDLLQADGQHLGGAILPGFNTPIDSFKRMLHVADFNHADIDANDAPGCSTESCIHINYTADTGSYLESLVDRWFNRLSANAVLVVCGGDADRVGRHRQHDYLQAPDLVFKGMRRQLESTT